jgi:hypothetical protein
MMFGVGSASFSFDPGCVACAAAMVACRCLQDLEWASTDASLQPLLSVLLAVAPFAELSTQQQLQDSRTAVNEATEQQGWSLDEAVSGLRQLLQQLQPVMRSSKRLSVDTTQQLVQLFFHPAMFYNR